MAEGPSRTSQASSWGVASIVFLLPLVFNPLAKLPFEAAKVEFFRYAVAATACIVILVRRFEKPTRTAW